MKKVLAILLILALTGCATATRGRSGAHWSAKECQKLQTKRDALIGATSGMAVLAGGGGVGAAFPDTQDKRIALGVLSLTTGVITAVLAPFVSSASQDYSDHCYDEEKK